MAHGYFNYDLYLATGAWERRTFLRHWWRFYGRDRRWVPPYYPAMRRALQAGNPHLDRLSPCWIRLEALPRPRPNRLTGSSSFPSPNGWHRTVAAAGLLHDRRRRDGGQTLTLPRCANDADTLSKLLEAAARESGTRSIIGPTHFSPYLGAGALTSHWHLLPPLHTPYNPPYLPSLLQAVMEESGQATLYEVPIPKSERTEGATGPADLVPLPPAQLADRLLPLLVAACAGWDNFPPPDTTEAAFVLGWLGQWSLSGLLALVGDNPAGFVLLQPDLGPHLRQAGGGRNPLWRVWLHRVAGHRVGQGRLLFGAVLPRWRGRGIGRQLMQATLRYGRQQGWERITVGPLPDSAEATHFLSHWDAVRRQEYRLYRWTPSPSAFFLSALPTVSVHPQGDYQLRSTPASGSEAPEGHRRSSGTRGRNIGNP